MYDTDGFQPCYLYHSRKALIKDRQKLYSRKSISITTQVVQLILYKLDANASYQKNASQKTKNPV